MAKDKKGGGKGSELSTIPFESIFLRKGVGAIRITVVNGKRTLLQRKMTNGFFKIASDADPNETTFLTNWETLQSHTGFQSNNIQYFKEAADDLTSMKVKFDVMNEQNIQSVGTANIFSAVTFRSDGTIYFEMPEITRRMMSDPDRFALINMQAQSVIDGNYAYILYEECAIHVKAGETPVWDLDEFKELMEIDKESPTYKEFKYLNIKVIKPAVEEVNKVTDLILQLVLHRKGKFVDKVSFKVERKPQIALDFTSVQESLNLEEEIVKYGVGEKVAERLVREFDRERILGNIEYLKRQIALDKVSDPAAYLVKAITEDYRPKESPLMKKIKEEEAAKEQKKAEQKARKDAAAQEQKSAHKSKVNAAQSHFDGLDEDARAHLMVRFAEDLALKNPLVYSQYKAKGLNSMAVKSSLMQYINENELNAQA